MLDILIIANFTSVPGENANNRFFYLANKLAENGCQVELLTSSFSHGLKKQKDLIPAELNRLSFQYTTVFEPGYSKNVCLERLKSHAVFGKNIKKYLTHREKPDVIYCAVPSLDAAKVAADYAYKKSIRFIIDVQDLWPEGFRMMFHVPVISDLLFAPMTQKANRIYARADEIIAVSRTYCERAIRANTKCKTYHKVYLGTCIAAFDANAAANPVTDKPDGEMWLAYCGTLGSSYDLICVLDAIELLKKRGISYLKFIVMGDGPRKVEFEAYAVQKNLDVRFTGRLPYDQMCGLLCACDITVNPITHGATCSIINKHADYAAAGLPVLNTQECSEYCNLVEEYHMGFNCINHDAADLADKLERLVINEKLRKDMGTNARRCAEQRFDRNCSYQEIIDTILASENNGDQ